jgi:hypothetical protein
MRFAIQGHFNTRRGQRSRKLSHFGTLSLDRNTSVINADKQPDVTRKP